MPKLEEYEVLATIGSGSYGTCKKIKRKSDGKVRVWKELEYGTMSDSEKQLLVSEVNLLRELKHPNIVRYHDRIIDKVSTKIYIVMEFCEGGDLAALIKKHREQRKYMEERFIWKVLYQLSLALRECHNHTKAGSTVLHRDLKPANVFLDSKNDCKLGDFGLARVLKHDTSFAKTYVGTPYYMSPELVNHSNYNQKSDIWSLGCLIYELCALVPPFLAATQKLLAMKIQNGHYKNLPKAFGGDLHEIIDRMLTVTESKRPSIEGILSCAGIRKYLNQPKDHGISPICNSTPSEASSSSSALDQREEDLRKWERKLELREKEISRRERVLWEREKVFEERLLRADYLHPTNKRAALLDKENAILKKDYGIENNYGIHHAVGKPDYGAMKDDYMNPETKYNRPLRFLNQNVDYHQRNDKARAFPYGLR